MRQMAFDPLVVLIVTWHVTIGSWSANTTDAQFEVKDTGSGPPLEVAPISPTSGYIQTPGWGHSPSYPKHMDSVVRVKVSENHLAMITMLHVNLPGRKVTCDERHVALNLYKTDMGSVYNHIWYCNRGAIIVRHLLPTGSDLYVHFKSRKVTRVGFRLFYSIHKEPVLLQKESDAVDSWNCSIPNFADFQPHFPCDMHHQCVNKEDERDCPYFSEDCGLGYVTLGSHCLLYLKNPKHTTWRKMELICERRGMRMASFRSREDYDRLVQYLEPLAFIWGFDVIGVGIHTSSTYLPFMYRKEVQNSDGTIAFNVWSDVGRGLRPACGSIHMKLKEQTNVYVVHIRIVYCTRSMVRSNLLCEIQKSRKDSVPKRTHEIKIQVFLASASNDSRLPLLHCPFRHVVRDFLACDVDSVCWSRDESSCIAPLTPHPPSLTCSNGVGRVPYTLVCDFRSDCKDGSDESFCEFPTCDLPDPFHCSDRECISWTSVCDGHRNCHNGADEELCSATRRKINKRPLPPAIVHLGHQGHFTVHRMNQTQVADLSPAVCPVTHFECPDTGYCMPVFLRCNGVDDCPGREDEAYCSSYTCPGLYRCRRSQSCLHLELLCDGIFHCPQKDDEVLCDLICPENCTCYGLAFFCSRPFQAKIKQLRFLDGRGSGIQPSDLKENVMLIHLSLASSRLTFVGELSLPNLHSLDLSDNQLREIQLHELSCLANLETLSLSGNPLLYLFQNIGTETSSGMHRSSIYSEGLCNISKLSQDIGEETEAMPSLRTLDLSRVKISAMNTSFLSLLPNLHTVNMSGSEVNTLLGEGFQALTQLRALDLRGCPLTHFPRNVLRGLERLKTVYSDNYKLCCPATLPAGFLLKGCRAPFDAISSCDALLKSHSYRIFVSVFAALSLLSNASSFIYQVFVKGKWIVGFDVFVAHLAVADFSMGVYQTVIAVADRLNQGTYLWEDNAWRKSATCKMSGFLSLVSCEVSALIICLITIERFLAIRFPYSTFNFGVRSAHVASLCAWGAGCLIAAFPLAPGLSRWEFYGQTAICVPLPLSGSGSAGHSYMLGTISVANLVIFLMVAAGQGFVYYSVHTNSLSACDTTRKAQDVTVARRLITVAMSSFLCWFPVGLVSILAATGTPVSGEVNVAMAILVLPFNSALNPLLYSVNIVLERRRKADEEQIKKRLMAQLRSMQHGGNIAQACVGRTNIPV